jgi:outer membrane receptor protein involved in Fe transport
VDRVEIITGGASAVYGSDALAGVVNFIIRDDFEGVMLETRYGVTERGDANYTDINLALGTDFAGGRGNAVFYAGHYDREPLLAADRSLTSVTLQEDGDGELFEAGSFTAPEGVLFNSVPGLGFPIFNPDGTPRPFINPDDQYNFAPLTYLQTPLERFSAGILGTLQVGENYEVYLETSFANNKAAQELAPVPFTEYVGINTDNPVLAPETAQLFQDNFTDAASAEPLLAEFTVSRRMSELGSRKTEQDRDYWRTVLGLRGTFGQGWDIDGWLSYTTSDELELLRNDGSLARVLQGLLVDPLTAQCRDPSGGCVPVDIFGAGRLSAQAVEFIRYQPLQNATKRTQKLASVFVSGTPADTWAGPLDVAAGLEWRSDSVKFRADDALFTGDTLGYRGDSPISGAESVTEIYAEAVVPLLEAAPAADSLTLELGARYSQYDNAGGAWTYKLGGNWQVNQSLRFRSMWQQSVRAPNNQELFQQQFRETSNFVGNILAVDSCSASQDPVANGYADACILQGLDPAQLGTFEAIPFYPVDFIRGGNDQLEPEQAETLTAGFVYTPETTSDWSVAVDYYEIDISKSIGEIDAKDICFDPANTANSFCDKIRRITDPNNAAVGNVFEVEELFNNRGRISTKGIDLQVNFTRDLPDALAAFDSGATLTGTVMWTHVLQQRFQSNPVSTIESCVGYFGSPCTGVTSSNTGAEDRLSANFMYLSDPVSVSLLAQWLSGTRSYLFREAKMAGTPQPVLAVPSIGSQFYLDINAAYHFNDNVSARFGIANLLDNDAPLIPGQTNNTDALLYDVFGRTYSLSLLLSFAR